MVSEGSGHIGRWLITIPFIPYIPHRPLASHHTLYPLYPHETVPTYPRLRLGLHTTRLSTRPSPIRL